MIDRKELKANARAAIRGTKPHPALITLAVFAILAVMQLLSLNISGDLALYRSMMESAVSGDFAAVYSYMQSSDSLSVLPWLLTLALDLMTMVVSMGYTLYTLRLMRGKNPGIGDVFDAFGLFLRVILLSVMRSIVVSLMSFLYAIPAAVLSMFIDPFAASAVCLPLFIPMFMVAYSFRLSDYILLDNPGYPSFYCLMLSRMAMKGRKWELFKLDLSFIGWMLLCLIPVAVLWVRPYRMAANAGFYDAVMPGFAEELKNRPKPQRPVYRTPGNWSVPGEKKDEPRDDDSENHDGF
ncbi:MAG: DUF975 family protein [Oscillospiraceae bacterium]